LVISCLSSNINTGIEHDTIHNILDVYIAKGNVKELFKVWHLVFKKEYEINTENGINRYKIFKSNLKRIQEHNSKNLSYTLGLNDKSDMTVEEFNEYYGVKEITKIGLNKYKRNLVGYNLDDFDDSEISVKDDPPRDRVAIDYTADLLVPRNQGSCGSCWTFSTMGAIEGNYSVTNRKNNTPITKVYLATQQLVDCNDSQKPNGGCNGGWMGKAMTYLQSSGIMADSDYPYLAKQGACNFNAKKLSPVKISGYEQLADTYALLQKGPYSGCVNVAGDFQSYRSGIYNKTCTRNCNHAIVVMGYGVDPTSKIQYWVVRNSWGASWGQKGHIFIQNNPDNADSCLISYGSWSLRPKIQ